MKAYRFVFGLAFIALALAQSGCVSLINKAQKQFFSDDPTLYSPAPYMQEKIKSRLGRSLREWFENALDDASRTPDSPGSSTELLYAGLSLIDYNYQRYIDAATQGRAMFETTADFTNIGLSTASTLATPTGTKTILSGLAAAVGGTKASVEKNFYNEVTTFVFISKMNAAREKVLAQIKSELIDATDKSKVNYGVVLLYLGKYYQAGTTLNALATTQTEDVVEKYDGLKKDYEKMQAEYRILALAKDKPELKFEHKAKGQVVISYDKKQSDGIVLSSHLEGETVYVPIARTGDATYVDLRPLRDGSKSEKRFYKAQFFLNDEPIGEAAEFETEAKP